MGGEKNNSTNIFFCLDADIDTLCVVPNVIFRSDFFQEMLTLLKKTPEITHITVSIHVQRRAMFRSTHSIRRLCQIHMSR